VGRCLRQEGYRSRGPDLDGEVRESHRRPIGNQRSCRRNSKTQVLPLATQLERERGVPVGRRIVSSCFWRAAAQPALQFRADSSHFPPILEDSLS
jgi:hypothetical protein